jgi:Uma2 family endonuclease
MNLPLKHMTAEEFAAWAQAQELGRYELIDGVVVEMNAERSLHAIVKFNAAVALREALKRSGLQGRVYTDGMAVKIADRVVHEPDAMLRLGAPLPDDDVLVTDPFIVVEVLSPSTGPVDTNVKLVNYFKLPSVSHYLVVNITKKVVLHYFRGADGKPELKVVESGSIAFGQQGLTLSLAAVFE